MDKFNEITKEIIAMVFHKIDVIFDTFALKIMANKMCVATYIFFYIP